MSDTVTSPKEISEEHDEGGTQEISKEQNEGDIPENSEEPNEGDTQQVTKKDNEGDIPEKGEETNEGDIQDITEEDNEVTATEDHAKKIFDLLEENSVSEVILTGEAGAGKTWMARKISKFVEKEHGESIWVSLDTKHDEVSLSDTIARQFSLPTSTDAREDNGDNEKKEWILNGLKEKIKEKLELVTKTQKFLLIVLDGLGTMNENDKNEKLVKEILSSSGLNGEEKLKFLITRRKEDGRPSGGLMKVAVEPLSGNEAFELLEKNVVKQVLDSQGFEELSEAIQKKKVVLPAEILMLAGTLNFIAEDKLALEAATNDLKQLLRYAYDKERGICTIDCFWHSRHFLGKHGGVHYNELITTWIMDGCLNPTNGIEKAYEEGHHVLMKLIDYHLLKMQEDNVVVVEGATLDLNKYCRREYSGTADPGLASVLRNYDWKVLEGITPADGMMKTLCGDKKENMISSLLIDGSRLIREVHKTFFRDKQDLKLLAIFNPRFRSSKELYISEMKNLLALMLRGSYLLEDVNHFLNLKALTILEISGAANLKEIPDDFFHQVSELQSLNLSAAGIKSLPSTFTELTKLRRLILRECSSLQLLPKLQGFSEIEVIDLSGCTNLEKIQEKSFKSLGKLQVIDFSRTKIEKLPIVRSLENLKKILLRGCRQLSGMRTLKQVSSLKILDLSGAVNIKEIMYDSFEGAEELRELDLSEAPIQFLPPDICNLQKLLKLRLKGCSSLKDLPEVKGLSRLEELDLSGCKSLVKLPELAALQNLKILDLKNCINLESLLDIKSLSKLEKLDLRRTNLWSKDIEESLNHLTRLQILK